MPEVSAACFARVGSLPQTAFAARRRGKAPTPDQGTGWKFG
ncbi:hypothetical protein [Lysobacter gummosus]